MSRAFFCPLTSTHNTAKIVSMSSIIAPSCNVATRMCNCIEIHRDVLQNSTEKKLQTAKLPVALFWNGRPSQFYLPLFTEKGNLHKSYLHVLFCPMCGLEYPK